MYSAPSSMYYVAVLCPTGVNEKILIFKQWMKIQFGCVVALKSPAHITLVPPFWLADGREEELLKVMASFKNDVDIFPIQLDSFSHFARKVLFVQVIQSDMLEKLKREVEDFFIKSFPGVIKKDERPFHPHVTIANRDLQPADFIKAWEHYSTRSFQESFAATSISLLKLEQGTWNVIADKDLATV